MRRDPYRAIAAGSAFLALVLGAPLAAHAQAHSPMFQVTRVEGARSLTSEQKQERQFLREAAAHLRFSQAAAKLALEKSSNARVREHAAAALNQANVMQPEVTFLLHARGMAMPIAGNDEMRVMKILKGAAGAKFDRVYLDEVALRGGQQDAARFERIAAVTRDPQLQGWVARHLPTLKYHVAMAGRVSAEGAQLARNPPPGSTTVMGANPAPGMVTQPAARAAAPRV